MKKYILKSVLLCSALVFTDTVSAQYYGGSADGDNMNEVKILTSCSYLPAVNYSSSYTGGNADGNNMNEVKILTSCSYLPVVNYTSSYTGGNADGNNMNEIKILASCNYLPVITYNNIYTGGNADGYARDTSLKCQKYIGCPIIITLTPPGDTTVCKGSSLNLTAGGGTNYYWTKNTDTIGNKSSVSITADTTASYTVFVSDTICSLSKTLKVTTEVLNAAYSGITNVCPGNSTTLKATGGTDYLWGNGNTADSISITPAKDTSITVTVKNGICPDTTISISVTLFNANPSITGDSSVCKGDSASLSVSVASSYLWSTGDTTQNIVFLPVTDSIVSVIITNGKCSGTAFAAVKVSDYPVADAGNDAAICKGNTLQIGKTGVNGISYLWLPKQGLNNDTNAMTSAGPAATTTYILTAVNGKCTTSDTVVVTVNPIPAVTASSVKTTLVQGDSTTISVSGAQQYIWKPGLFLSDSTSASIICKPEKTTTFIVTGTDNNGCKNTDTIVIVVIDKTPEDSCGKVFVPNAFSPNSNIFNDRLKVRFPVACIKEIQFAIYDRWGVKMFETNDLREATETGWDGTYKGNKVNTGVYIYYLNMTLKSNNETQIVKGNISLIK